MTIHPRRPITAALLFLLLSCTGALAGERPTPQEEPQAPERMELRWNLDAPALGISWHGSLALTRAPVDVPEAPPRRTRPQTGRGLADVIRTAVQLVHALLRFPAGILAVASAHLLR